MLSLILGIKTAFKLVKSFNNFKDILINVRKNSKNDIP